MYPINSLTSPVTVRAGRFYGDKSGFLHVGYKQYFQIDVTDPDIPFGLRVYENGSISMPKRAFLQKVSVQSSGKVTEWMENNLFVYFRLLSCLLCLLYLIISNSHFFIFQILGIEDLFVYDGGSFYSDSNSSLGQNTSAGEYEVKTLHVQNEGTFELFSNDKQLNSRLTTTNLTVRDHNNVV